VWVQQYATYKATHDSLQVEIIIKLIKSSISKDQNVQRGEKGSAGWLATAETATRTKSTTVIIPVGYEVI